MTRRLVVACGLFACVAGSSSTRAATSAESLRLVPFPKQVELKDGRFDFSRALQVREPKSAAAGLGETILAELRRAGLHEPGPGAPTADGTLVIQTPNSGEGQTLVAMTRDSEFESYSLEVYTDAIIIQAKDSHGLRRGVATLVQLIRANRDEDGIPCPVIQDWPSIRWRAFQDDLTRGPSSTLSELKREAALGAELKLNLFTYYMEHQFAFRKHPVIGPKDGSLLPEELAALEAYARSLGMDLLGNQQSFGHFAHILKHEQYAGLRETDWILTPVQEGTYALLDDLYSEVIPLLSFPFFNVCCDETQGLGSGPSKALAAQIGEGGVYVRHIGRVYELVHGRYGKRMMMWGDIILNHPDRLAEIPKDTIMLTWGYHPGESFESRIVPFAKSGYDFFVCPGVNNWNRLLPDFQAATINIRNFVRDGAREGTLGVLNTAWDDDGETLNAPNWHGFAWGAECAWNASKTTPEAFNRRIGGVLFAERGERFGQAISALSGLFKLSQLNGCGNGRFWALELGRPIGTIQSARAEAEQIIGTARPAIEHLEAVRVEATANAELLDALIWSARRVELIGQRTLDGLAAAESYQAACEGAGNAAQELERADQLIAGVLKAHRAMAEEYRDLWARENRPYGLDVPMGRFERLIGEYEAIRTRLAGARDEQANGRALPLPKEIGLEIVELAARRCRTSRVEPLALKPQAEWRVPSSHRRLGIVVQAGSVARTDLPVEVQVRVEAEVIGRPAQAYRVDGSKATEIPVQLDPTEEAGVGHLVVMLNGTVPARSAAEIHVYLGTDTSGAPAGGARTRKAENGSEWLENDRVRLLLGTEGAHIYEWRVMALADRDITMPGATDWLGFSDITGEHRRIPSKLTCTARGPAMVRYACVGASGMTKTVSLYAGASWVEVTLSRPSWYYWDFDDPANFSADAGASGQYLFSNGRSGPVGKLSEGIAAQVKTPGVHWAVKYIPDKWAMGMVVPEVPVTMAVGPGGGFGGVGVESEAPAAHFISYAGMLQGSPETLMESLRRTLSLRQPPEVTVHAVQKR